MLPLNIQSTFLEAYYIYSASFQKKVLCCFAKLLRLDLLFHYSKEKCELVTFQLDANGHVVKDPVHVRTLDRLNLFNVSKDVTKVCNSTFRVVKKMSLRYSIQRFGSLKRCHYGIQFNVSGR